MSYNVNLPKGAKSVDIAGRRYEAQDGRAEVPPTIARMIRHVADVTAKVTSLSHTNIPGVKCLTCGHQSLFGPECKWCGSEDVEWV